MALELFTAPTNEPLALDEIKSHLRIQHNDEDDLLRTLLQVARVKYETDVDERQLVTATWKYYLDCFPENGVIYLPRPPLASVSSITYVDTGGTTQTWSSAEYLVDAKSDPGRITTAYGYVFPFIRRQTNSIIITFISGVAAASVAEIDKAAIKLLVGHLYENREATGDKPTMELPLSYCSIVANRRTGDYPR